MKTPTGLALASFLVAMLWWPLVPVGVGAALVVRRVGPVVQARRAQRARVDALAETIDLIVIAISSGVTVTGSLRLLAERGPPPVQSGFAAVLDQLDAGGTITHALQRAASDLGAEYQSLTVTLAQAEREGSPLGALLIRLADEAANARRRRAELAARQLPVQMLLPLVLCSLPAVVLGAVVPLVLVSLRRL